MVDRQPPSYRVKPISRDAGAIDKHKRVRSLVCFSEVHEMVITGWPLSEIAQHVQKLKHESEDITEDALIWALGEYRKDLPAGVLVQKTLPQVFTKAAKQIHEGLDALAELESLYKLQMKRVEIDHAVETKIKKLMPNMTAEIRMAKDILETYAEMQMDLGLVDRHLGKVDVSGAALEGAAAAYGKDSVRKVIEDPQSRRKLLGLVERLVEVNVKRSELRDADADADADVEALPAAEDAT